MAEYIGDQNKIVNSSYLFDTLQDLKTEYIDVKVDKVDGKGLSTNDLTSTLKTNYDKAYSQTHTHSNKDILDSITEEDITNWNAGVTEITTTGNGNAITAISVNDNEITVTKGATFLTTHPTITQGTNTTTTAAPSFGGSFTAISGITKDSNGHVTAYETKTITLPSLSFESTALDLSTLT